MYKILAKSVAAATLSASFGVRWATDWVFFESQNPNIFVRTTVKPPFSVSLLITWWRVLCRLLHTCGKPLEATRHPGPSECGPCSTQSPFLHLLDSLGMPLFEYFSLLFFWIGPRSFIDLGQFINLVLPGFPGSWRASNKATLDHWQGCQTRRKQWETTWLPHDALRPLQWHAIQRRRRVTCL